MKQIIRNIMSNRDGYLSVKAKAGMLMNVDVKDDFKPHNADGGNAEPVFLLERPTIGLDDEIAVGEMVTCRKCDNKIGVYGWLKAGENVVEGDLLCSAGDGSLRKYTAPAIDENGTATHTINTNAIVAKAKEDIDNTAGVEMTRIDIEVFK